MIWHIALKDLRRFRWALFFWAVLVAAKLVIGAALVLTDGGRTFSQFYLFTALAELSQYLERVGALLLAAIVLEDPVVGNSAFWLTRPISGARLLAAKCVVLTLSFVVLPLLVTLPWWLLCDYDNSQIVRASGETLQFHAPHLLAAWFFAVISEGLPQALGRSVLGFGICAVTAALAAFSMANLARDQRPASPTFYWLVAVGSVLLLVLHQYLTRRRVRSLGLAGGLLALFAWFLVVPPTAALTKRGDGAKAVSKPLPPPALPATDDPSPASLRLTQGTLTLSCYPAKLGALPLPPWCAIALFWKVEGLPENAWLVADRISLESRWPSGLERTSIANPSQSLDFDLIASWHDQFRSPELQSRKETCQAVGRWEGAKTEAGTPSTANYQGWFHVQRLARIPIPLQNQRQWENGERITGVVQSDQEVRLIIVRRRADLDSHTSHRDLAPPRDAKKLRLVQPDRELVYLQKSWFRAVRIGTVHLSWEEIRFLPFAMRDGPTPKAELKVPLTGAQLVQLHLEDGPRFRLQGSIDTIRTETPALQK